MSDRMPAKEIEMDLSLAETYFHLSEKGSKEPLYSMSAHELIGDPLKMKELLTEGGKLVKAIGLELAVSFVGLAFFGLAATKLYALARYDRLLDLSIGNLTIQLESHNDHAHVVLKVGDWGARSLSSRPEERENAVREDWENFIRGSLAPLVEATAGAAGLKSAMIWNQYGARVAYLMDYLRDSLPSPEAAEPFDKEFQTLRSLPTEWFNRRKNPFDHSPVYIDSPYQPGAKIIVRSACCMYDKRENGAKCYNCPVLKESEREMRFRAIAASAAAGTK